MTTREIVVGEEYGNWKILKEHGSDRDGKKVYLCECRCGTRKTVRGSYLKDGRSRKCKECVKKDGVHHGGRKPKLDDAAIQIIVTRYVNGESSSDLALEYGINLGTVLNYVKRNGCKTRNICEHGTRCRKPPGVAARNQKYKQYKASAKHRGIQFDLSKERFVELTSDKCYYCGASPSNTISAATGSYTYNGIDRVDNSKGYFEGNVVSCCKHCNRAKDTRSLEEFIEWACQIAIKQSPPID